MPVGVGIVGVHGHPVMIGEAEILGRMAAALRPRVVAIVVAVIVVPAMLLVIVEAAGRIGPGMEIG